MVTTGENGHPRILFIDAYDSYTYNIVSVVECYLGVEVTVIKIDDHIGDLASYIKPFSAVIAGPGPGHPNDPKDAGLFRELWGLQTPDIPPVLGICLGFQSLVLAHGGKILQLAEPRHGMLRKIRASGKSIFAGIRGVTAVQYHSLYAQIGEFTNEDVRKASFECSTAFKSVCPELIPLAWDLKADNLAEKIGLQKENPKAILMGVAHKEKPFFGVQFHPESICSDQEARNIIPNWWALAQQWNHSHRRHLSGTESLPSSAIYAMADTRSLREKAFSYMRKAAPRKRSLKQPTNTIKAHCNGSADLDAHYKSNHQPGCSSCIEPSHRMDVITRTVGSSNLTVPEVCGKLGLQNDEMIVLDSECNQNPQTGKHSIIGIMDSDTIKFEYNIGQSYVRHVSQRKRTTISLKPHGGSIFAYLKYFVGRRKTNKGRADVPFWGGLMGYITYEACLETLDIQSAPNPVDLSFAFVERSVVINHQQGMIYIQSIKDKDHDWVDSVASILAAKVPQPLLKAHPPVISDHISLPDERLYKESIRECFDFLRKGDSYELCLTTECRVKVSKEIDSWALFCRLRKRNAAPFAAYLKLGPLTHIASSPERFMSWSRPARPASEMANGIVSDGSERDRRMSSTFQFRPIKGTVKRQPNNPALPAVTLEQATAILSTPKERAENLMIVDLIRHDLHSVVGSGNVNVSKLMVVEEYATLYQLVSVIEGTLYLDNPKEDPHKEDPGNIDDDLPRDRKNSTSRGDLSTREDHHSVAPRALGYPSCANADGIDVLAASLPPGSMTGAPKRRSCSILQQIENRNRGVYSGVLGYLDVGGGGDFSVVIRSASKWDTPISHASPTCEPPFNSRDQTTDRLSHDVKPSSNGQSESISTSANGTVKHSDHDREDSEDSSDAWVIGAGGAVTCLSTEDGEWEEMHGKLSSTLAAFVDN